MQQLCLYLDRYLWAGLRFSKASQAKIVTLETIGAKVYFVVYFRLTMDNLCETQRFLMVFL